MMKHCLAGLTVVLLAACARSGPGIDPTVTLAPPGGRTRAIDFTTDEGTGMSVTVSPDGTWIAFDLLGHIYRMPIAGGEAKAITQNTGPALNFHPAISPDGKQIAFTSDRNGQLNIWVMDADGGHPRLVHGDPATRYLQPAWDPSGDFVFGLRQTRPFVPTEFVMVHLGGGPGTGFPIPASPAWLPRLTGAGFTTRPISPGPMPAAASSASTGAPGTGRPSSPAMNRSAGRLSARTAGGSPLR